MNISRFVLFPLLSVLCLSCSSEQETLPFALASSMAPVATQLADLYETDRIYPTVASSGVLYAQIVRGAPYAVAIFADENLSRRTAQRKPHRKYRCLADASLALWAPATQSTDDLDTLFERSDLRILIPDPAAAPAGVAAARLLRQLGLDAAEIIPVGSAAHTVRLGLRGAGDLAVVPVPLLLAVERQGDMKGVWTTPDTDCCRLSYQAVLLQDSEAAAALFAFLTGDAVGKLLRRAGFDAPQHTVFCTPGELVTSHFL